MPSFNACRRLVAAFIGFCMLSFHAYAIEFDVTTLLDEVDKNAGDGKCETASNECSLRAAVMEANALEGLDTINLPSGNYNLTINSSNSNLAAIGDLNITDSVSIVGEDRATTVISGSNLFRIFAIARLTESTFPEASISNVTLTGGLADKSGGLVLNNSILNLNNVVLENAGSDANLVDNVPAIFSINSYLSISNSVVRNNDQGLYAENSRVEIADSVFEGNIHKVSKGIQPGGSIMSVNSNLVLVSTKFLNNHALESGGAIYAELSDVAMFKSEFSGNKSTTDDKFYFGGAVILFNSYSRIQETNFTNNFVTGSGGAIYAARSSLEVFKSTFLNNQTSNERSGIGGAIAVESYSDKSQGFSDIFIEQSIFTGNNAVGGGAVAFSPISNDNDLFFIVHSEISGNTATYGAGVHLLGSQQANILNSTISGNIASQSGGGILIENDTDSLTSLVNVTLAYNEAGSGANVFNDGAAELRMVNTVISNPVGADNCRGDMTSRGTNLSSDGSCALDVELSDLPNTDPQLSPLADNGGFSKTHAPAQDSAVIDSGNNQFCLDSFSLDQRYHYRGDSQCDIGAFEQNAALANRGGLSFSVTESEVSEKGAKVRIAVSRVDGSDGLISAFVADTLEGTAEEGDYELSDTSLSWKDGDSDDKYIDITINDNNEKTSNRTIQLALVSNTLGIDIENKLHTVTIIDDESLPMIVEFSKAVYQASEGDNRAYVTLVRSNGVISEPETVQITTSDGTAKRDVDYFGGAANATFPADKKEILFEIDIELGKDNLYEEDKDFFVTITAVENAVLGDLKSAKVVIVDDDDQNATYVSFGHESYTISEDEKLLKIQLVRTNNTSQETKVTLDIASGLDLISSSGTWEPIEVTFNAGETAKTVEIDVSKGSNDVVDGDRSFSLTLTNPVDSELGTMFSTNVTLKDNDNDISGKGDEPNTSKGAASTSWAGLFIFVLLIIRRVQRGSLFLRSEVLH